VLASPHEPGYGARVSDFEALYRAVESRDARWDGRVFVGVTSTGIYCRPICPVPMPRRENVRFYGNAASAERAGFRACRRCRPEQSPESPDWDVRADLVGRALRLISSGLADEAGVDGIARALAVSPRHLHRIFVRELGVGPAEVARSRRAGLAKQLLDETDLPSTDIAFAAGFRSLRAYNGALRRSFGRSPTEIRAHRPGGPGPLADGAVHLRLAYRRPLDLPGLLAFVGARAIPHVELVEGRSIRRALPTAGGATLLRLEPAADEDAVELSVAGHGPGELAALVQAARRSLDLDADPATIDPALGGDPIVGPLVAAAPGRRLPGAFDPWATTVLAVLAQGTSLTAARAAAGRIALAHGPVASVAEPRIDRLFPGPAILAGADLSGVGAPARALVTIGTLARRVAEGRLDLEGGGDPERTIEALRTIPGIGPWTAAYVAMRVLRDPDAFPPGDAAVRAAFRRRGLPADDRSIARAAEAWRPWRGYAVAHLWSPVSGGSGATGAGTAALDTPRTA